MNKPVTKETYILDDSIAFELMDLLKAKPRQGTLYSLMSTFIACLTVNQL